MIGRSFLILVALFVAFRPPGGSADTEWKQGIVLDTDRETLYVGSDISTSTEVYHSGDYSSGSGGGEAKANYAVWQKYVIADDTYIYMAKQFLRWFWSKPAKLTVNAPVEFRIDGDRIIIRDERRKIVKAKIYKKILRVTQSRQKEIPDEMKKDSAVFLAKRLDLWTEHEARAVLGEPIRRRNSADSQGVIYAFRDPTKRYREFEPRFDKASGLLTGVYIVSWDMTW